MDKNSAALFPYSFYANNVELFSCPGRTLSLVISLFFFTVCSLHFSLYLSLQLCATNFFNSEVQSENHKKQWNDCYTYLDPDNVVFISFPSLLSPHLSISLFLSLFLFPPLSIQLSISSRKLSQTFTFDVCFRNNKLNRVFSSLYTSRFIDVNNCTC